MPSPSVTTGPSRFRRWPQVASPGAAAKATKTAVAAVVVLALTLTVGGTAAAGTMATASRAVPVTPSPAPPARSDLEAFYRVPDPLGSGPPGSIIRSEPIPLVAGLPARVTAYRILYHSESITGTDIAVSGIVVVPGRPAPAGGYRIVTWAHGTTGLAGACAPSKAGTDAIPYLAQLLQDGYVVTATDYQGLGTDGISPYLVGQSEGQSVLDAARAARDLLGATASDEVLIFGHSQGGQAALFAGQIAPSYAPELFVVGVVAAAPVSDVSEFVPAVVGHAPDPLAVYTVSSLYAWSETYDDLSLTSALTTRAIVMMRSIDDECITPLAAQFGHVAADQLFRPGWEDTTTVRAHEAQNEPGLAPTSAPILVIQGTADTLIPYAGTTSLVDRRLCRAEDDVVQYEAFRHAGHTNVLVAAQPDVLRWIQARLTGKGPPPDSCATAGRSRSLAA